MTAVQKKVYLQTGTSLERILHRKREHFIRKLCSASIRKKTRLRDSFEHASRRISIQVNLRTQHSLCQTIGSLISLFDFPYVHLLTQRFKSSSLFFYSYPMIFVLTLPLFSTMKGEKIHLLFFIPKEKRRMSKNVIALGIRSEQVASWHICWR